jgi:hypothetical protein
MSDLLLKIAYNTVNLLDHCLDKDLDFERLAQDLKHKDGAKDLLQLAASVVAGPDIRDACPGKAWLNMTHRQVIPL